MLNRLILVLGLIVLSSGLLATERVYQADLEGMVCAFCAYSVSRDLAALPGVESDSVDVDLVNGTVTFKSAGPVSEEKLLKPILMGRRQVMKVSFVPANDETIKLQLFFAVAGN